MNHSDNRVAAAFELSGASIAVGAPLLRGVNRTKVFGLGPVKWTVCGLRMFAMQWLHSTAVDRYQSTQESPSPSVWRESPATLECTRPVIWLRLTGRFGASSRDGTICQFGRETNCSRNGTRLSLSSCRSLAPVLVTHVVRVWRKSVPLLYADRRSLQVLLRTRKHSARLGMSGVGLDGISHFIYSDILWRQTR